jgi:prophage regulatory protein
LQLAAPEADRFLPRPLVLDISGLSKTILYERIAAGHFPAPVKLGRSSRWLLSEITEWQRAQVQARGGAHA